MWTWRPNPDRPRARVLEALLVVLLAVWVVFAGLSAENPWLPIGWGLVVVSVVGLGRRWPLVGLPVAFLGLFSVDAVSGGRALEDVFLVTLIWACFVVGRWGRLKRQPWAAAGVLLLLSSNVVQEGREVVAADIVFPVLFTAAPWLLGLGMQLTARRADKATSYAGEVVSTRTEDIRRATDEERLRIAHELHDVVAHNLSALSLQAQVTRRRFEDGGEVVPEDLAALEESARLAMTDLRRLLGVLRPSAGEPGTRPHEGIGDLPALVEQCARAGQRVVVSVDGTPRVLPPALSLVAYRVIQEALTNARRHGGHGPSAVRLDWAQGRLVITVSNPYDGDPHPEPGHGRRGIEERVTLFGGTTRTTTTGGSWVLEASLPTPVDAEASAG